MKTIAITIEEDILERVDRLARSGKNRSRIIREAVRKYVALVEQTAEEEREAAIVHRHRDRLQRESQALIKQQAKE